MRKSIYDTPESDLVEDGDLSEPFASEKKTLRELKKSQSIVGTIIATIIVCIPTVGLSIKAMGEIMPILLWVFPGFIVGIGVRLMAPSYDYRLRLIPSLTLFSLLVTIVVYFELTPLMYLVALTNAIIVLFTSRKKLSRDQEKAIWLHRQGKFEL
jgi:hypothetical protein